MKGSRIHIDLLKVFLDLAETKSFSRTAARNCLTQSAVSQQLTALEQLFSKKLIDRGRGRFALTEEGEALLDGCRRILQTYHETANRIRRRLKDFSGTVKVETIYSIGLYELAPFVRTFMRSCQRVNLHIEYNRANRIYANVLAGACDLGIVAYPRPHPQLKTIAFKNESMVLVCPPKHPFARREKVRVKELDRRDFIAFEQDIPTRWAVDRLLQRRRAHAHIVHAFDNIDTIKRAVEIGLGVSILPRRTALHEVRSKTLSCVPLADGPLFRPTGIIVDKRRSLSTATRAFIRWLTGGARES